MPRNRWGHKWKPGAPSPTALKEGEARNIYERRAKVAALMGLHPDEENWPLKTIDGFLWTEDVDGRDQMMAEIQEWLKVQP